MSSGLKIELNKPTKKELNKYIKKIEDYFSKHPKDNEIFVELFDYSGRTVRRGHVKEDIGTGITELQFSKDAEVEYCGCCDEY